MKANRVKQLITEGKPTCGSWVSLCSPIGAEVMGQIGFDWLLIDMEHGAGDMQTLMAQLQALSGSDTVAFTRVPWNDHVWIKRVLDLGVTGVMIPGVRTVEEARYAVAATKYPPAGFRGVSSSVRASRYGQDKGYLADANDQVMVILQIETREAVEHVETILDLPGIDVAFVGPNDLAASLGHFGDPGHEEVQQAIARVEAAARQRHIPLGSISRSWEASKALLDKGYQLVSLGADISFLTQAGRTAVSNFDQATGRV